MSTRVHRGQWLFLVCQHTEELQMYCTVLGLAKVEFTYFIAAPMALCLGILTIIV